MKKKTTYIYAQNKKKLKKEFVGYSS